MFAYGHFDNNCLVKWILYVISIFINDNRLLQ